MQAEKEVEVLEAKRHKSRIELEASMREKRALEEAEKRRWGLEFQMNLCLVVG